MLDDRFASTIPCTVSIRQPQATAIVTGGLERRGDPKVKVTSAFDRLVREGTDVSSPNANERTGSIRRIAPAVRSTSSS